MRAGRGRGLAWRWIGLGLLTACHARHRVAHDDASAMRAVNAPAVDDDANEPIVPAAAPSPWCVTTLPHASARAIDRRGHRWSLTDTTLRDETAAPSPSAATRITLSTDDPTCPVSRDALSFDRDGSATALVHGRIFVRAPGAASPWVPTPLCTDLAGEPVVMRAEGRGWTVVTRRFPGQDAALMMTDDATGRVGWYALTALDRTMTSVLLESDGSMLTLSQGGHLVVVDRERHVAGEVIAANTALYDSMTRTGLGIVAARDVDATTRELVNGAGLRALFERDQRPRPPGRTTRRVFALQHGARLALTDQGVEWSAGARQPFLEVARWPDATREADPGNHASFGWLDDGSPAVAYPDGWMRSGCTENVQNDR